MFLVETKVSSAIFHYSVAHPETMYLYCFLYSVGSTHTHTHTHTAIERFDRQVATSIQFQVGDKCRFKLPDSQTQDGEISALYSAEDCHTVYVYDASEEWVSSLLNSLNSFMHACPTLILWHVSVLYCCAFTQVGNTQQEHSAQTSNHWWVMKLSRYATLT